MTSGSTKKPSIIHVSFEVAILLKGIHAALEIIGAVLLWVVKPEALNAWIQAITQNELAENPSDFVANLLVRTGQHYTVNSQHFGVFYLLSHGVMKVVLVVLLWRRKLWAYPLTVAALALFVAYQIFRWISHHSFFLILLSAFDAVIVWLTISEYSRLRQEASLKVGV